MNLPRPVVERILRTWNESGNGWVDRFEERLHHVCLRWQLTNLQPFPNLSYHFVARAKQFGNPVVLKLGVPNPEFNQAAQALRAFDGHGCVRLLEYDPRVAAMLLEDVRPGAPLEQSWTAKEDDPHTTCIANTMLRLWRAPTSKGHPTLGQWFRYFEQDQPQISTDLLDRARALFDELNRTRGEEKLLHGDLHHGNLLQSECGLKAIDPKGVIGEPGFEIYALLRNPVQATPDQLLRLATRRIKIVSQVTNIDSERLRQWGFCGTMLSACWIAEEGGTIPEATLELARRLDSRGL